MTTENPDYYKLGEREMFLVSQKALIIKNGKLLILKSTSKAQEWSERWGLPGGLLEMNEGTTEGLQREVMEETGLRVTVGRLISVGSYYYDNFVFENRGSYKVRFIGIAYTCRVQSGQVKLSHEHKAYKWASREELKDLPISPDSKAAVDKYLE